MAMAMARFWRQMQTVSPYTHYHRFFSTKSRHFKTKNQTLLVGELDFGYLHFYDEFTEFLGMQKVKKPFYRKDEEVLVVEDADFSFAYNAVRMNGDGRRMTVTTLNTFRELKNVYRDAQYHMSMLIKMGAKVLCNVDARKMASDPQINCKKYNKIIFNQPLCGSDENQYDGDIIRKNQELVTDYIGQAKTLGDKLVHEIHVSHNEKWELEKLGENNGLKLIKKIKLPAPGFPVYNNKRGAGKEADRHFSNKQSALFIFSYE